MTTYGQLRSGKYKFRLSRSGRKRRHAKSYSILRGKPQMRGVCMKVFTMSPKKPNSAVRKVARLRLSNKKKKIVYIPGHGHSLSQYSNVLIRGGRVRDLPGIHHRIIRGALDLGPELALERAKRRSKFGAVNKKKN